jgi:hypothetical protein
MMKDQPIRVVARLLRQLIFDEIIISGGGATLPFL